MLFAFISAGTPAYRLVQPRLQRQTPPHGSGPIGLQPQQDVMAPPSGGKNHRKHPEVDVSHQNRMMRKPVQELLGQRLLAHGLRTVHRPPAGRCRTGRPRSLSSCSKKCPGTASPYKSKTPLRSPPAIHLLYLSSVAYERQAAQKKTLQPPLPLLQQLDIHLPDLLK